METAIYNWWTPDNSDQYALTQDLARIVDDIEETVSDIQHQTDDYPHFSYRRTNAYTFEPVENASLTWDPAPFEGPLSGFTTTNQRVFTCTRAGLYDISCTVAAVASSTPTYYYAYLRKNNELVLAGNSATVSFGFTSPSAHVRGSVRFMVGDTFDIVIGSGANVAGATGRNTALFVDFVRP